jgi:nucleotide-binding universal stress UspA family protein
MLTRILVPLDGSFLAERALDLVKNLVDSRCQITLLMAVQQPEVPIYGANPMVVVNEDYFTIEAAYADAKRYLDEIAERLLKCGFDTDVRVEVGNAAERIVEAANELNVDMILMSTHGRSGISRWLFGSVTMQVLGTAARPVLVLPNGEIRQQFESKTPEVNYG